METNGRKELSRAIIHLFAKVFLIVIVLLLVAALIIKIVGPRTTEIRDWYDLDAIRNNLDGRYILINRLDSASAGYEELASATANQGKGWQPIGTRNNPFSGIFDGQGLEIRNLCINRPDEKYIGVFSFLRHGCTIKNVEVVNVDIIGNYYVGSLVSTVCGTVSNCHSSGKVTGNKDVGGLAGIIGSSGYCHARGTVSNSYSTVNVSGDYRVGGLVAWNNWGDVSTSYSSGKVTGNEDVGGLVGYNDINGCVTNSFWDIQTSGQATSDGGMGKTTAQMKSITTFTFTGSDWNIIAVALNETNPAYIWNIVDNATYPFLSWEP